MAEKRMFSNLILNNDDFIEMPAEAQMLYVRLNMAADDRGICDSPRTVMRSCGASNDSMKLLIAKKFILLPAIKPSVVVIKHWWVHNNARKERFKETKHTDVISELFYDDNKSYSQNPNDGHISCVLNGKLIWPPDLPEIMENLAPSLPPADTQPAPIGYPADTQPAPQNRIEENRLDKVSLEEGEDRKGESERETQLDLLSADERKAKIKFWKARIDFMRSQNFDAGGMYNLAKAKDGITMEEIDSYKEENADG